MSEHRWGEPDKDGVRACQRRGCTVRLARTARLWQSSARCQWKHRRTLPACTGTDAPDATLTRRCTKCGVPFDGPASATLFHCERCAKTCGQCTPEATPSPLEVVKHALEHAPINMRNVGLSALSTLEESIRAEEREACAKVADLAMEVSLPDRRRIGDAIRARVKR